MRENKNDRKQGKSERKTNDSREGKKHHASICIRNVPFIFCSCKFFFDRHSNFLFSSPENNFSLTLEALKVQQKCK
jgi:hypothetical protein